MTTPSVSIIEVGVAGPPGAPGAPGSSGGGGLPFTLDLSSTVVADPGAGKIRFNAMNILAANAMIVSQTCGVNGANLEPWFPVSVIYRGTVTLSAADGGFLTYQTTGEAQDFGTYWFIPVEFVAGAFVAVPDMRVYFSAVGIPHHHQEMFGGDGTYYWTVPLGITMFWVTGNAGGGGGGGGCNAFATTNSGGGGGGAGGGVWKYPVPVGGNTPLVSTGAVIEIVIGPIGAAGGAGNPGNSGGDAFDTIISSSVGGDPLNTTPITLGGGRGGNGGVSATGYAEGGARGSVTLPTPYLGAGATFRMAENGSPGITSGNYGIGGKGGAALLGGGGMGATFGSVGTDWRDATGPGAGGGGGYGSNGAGGNGGLPGAGFVLIEW